MKGVLKLSAIMTFIAVLSCSCSMTDGNRTVKEPATLELSKYAVELSNEALDASPLITVTTNQETIKVQSLAPEWMEVEYRDKKIYISAKPNTSGAKRTTNLLIFAGAAFETVKIEQSGSPLFLELSQKEVIVPAEGTTVLIDVKSNGSNWKFEVDEPTEEWIKVTRIDKFLQLVVSPNNVSGARVGRIYVEVDGTSPVEITVGQQAYNNGAKYGLPLLLKKPTKHAIIDYEKKQGSYVAKYQDSNFGSALDIPYIVFLYASPVFKSVTYYIVEETKTIHEIDMISNDAKTLMSDEFIQILIDKGFEIVKKKGSNSYSGVSKELGFSVDVDIHELKESKIVFAPIEE